MGGQHRARTQPEKRAYLASGALLAKLLLEPDERRGAGGHEDAVADVAEHDGEQERERDDSEQSRVDLLVRADAVRVDDRLEALGELVRAVERRRVLGRAQLVQDARHARSGVLLLPDASVGTRK